MMNKIALFLIPLIFANPSFAAVDSSSPEVKPPITTPQKRALESTTYYSDIQYPSGATVPIPAKGCPPGAAGDKGWTVVSVTSSGTKSTSSYCGNWGSGCEILGINFCKTGCYDPCTATPTSNSKCCTDCSGQWNTVWNNDSNGPVMITQIICRKMNWVPSSDATNP